MSHAPPASDLCYNCSAPLSGAYCAVCGQKALPLNPGLHDFLHDFVHEMLHVDGKIFRSVRTLFLSPGLLTREQFEGRRARWISPIRLYLIFSLVYFALASVPSDAGILVTVNRAGTDAETEQAFRRLGFQNEQEFQDVLRHTWSHWAPRVMFLLVPLFAWLVNRASRSSALRYPQHLYFALHVHAVWFAAGAVSVAARAAPWPIVPRMVGPLAVLYGLAYVVLAFRTAYGGTIGQALRRSAVVVAVYWFAVILASAALVLPVLLVHRGATS